MPELTPQLIKLTREDCHLAFNDDGSPALGYEWILEELCPIALEKAEQKP